MRIHILTPCLLLLFITCEESSLPDHTWTAALMVKVEDDNTGQPIPEALVRFSNDHVELFPPRITTAAGLATYEIEIVKGHGVRLDAYVIEREGYLPWIREDHQPAGADLDEERPSAQVTVTLSAI